MTKQDKSSEFEALSQPAMPAVRRMLRQYVRNTEEVHDIAQDTLVRAWTYFDSYDHNTPFATWLCTIARRICIDKWRRTRICKMVSLETEHDNLASLLVDETHDPAQLALRASYSDEIIFALMHLTDEQVTSLLLLSNGATYEQIAEVTHVPIGTVRSRLGRARRAAQQYIQRTPACQLN